MNVISFIHRVSLRREPPVLVPLLNPTMAAVERLEERRSRQPVVKHLMGLRDLLLCCLPDVDECWRTPGVCGEGAECVNLEGSFECRCLLGYRVQDAAKPFQLRETFQPLREMGPCRVVDCGQLPPVAEEVVVGFSGGGTTYGSVVLLGCRVGWVWSQGGNSSTCRADGSWSIPGLVCESRLTVMDVWWCDIHHQSKTDTQNSVKE